MRWRAKPLIGFGFNYVVFVGTHTHTRTHALTHARTHARAHTHTHTHSTNTCITGDGLGVFLKKKKDDS